MRANLSRLAKTMAHLQADDAEWIREVLHPESGALIAMRVFREGSQIRFAASERDPETGAVIDVIAGRAAPLADDAFEISPEDMSAYQSFVELQRLLGVSPAMEDVL